MAGYSDLAVEREIFVARETELKELRNLASSDGSLVFMRYGVGGVGKSTLKKKFIEYLEEQRVNGEAREQVTLYTQVNLEDAQHQSSAEFLATLAINLRKKFESVKFVTFWIARAILWEKRNPGIVIRDDSKHKFVKELHILTDGIAIFDGGITGVITKVAEYFSSNLNALPDETIAYLKALSSKDADEIEQILPKLLADDLNEHRNIEGSYFKKIVFVVDTYETLWSGKNRVSDKCHPDSWLREVAVHLKLPYLFVLFGRERIDWDKCAFKGAIESKELDGFSEKEAVEFLDAYKVTEADIREQIIQNTQGLPLYLYLEAKTYQRLQNPTVQDFRATTKQEILERFIRHLSSNEQALLELLAHPISFDAKLIKIVVEEYLNKSALREQQSFLSLSFIKEENIKEENDNYYMHQLVREYILGSQKENANDYYISVENFLYKLYEQSFKDLELKDFKEQNRQTLSEQLYRAYYHKRKVSALLELFDWVNSTTVGKFYKAGYYETLIAIYSELIEEVDSFNEREEGLETRLATSYNNLARLYWSMGEYDEAFPLYEQSLKIREKVSGKEHPNTAISYNNLAGLYESMGKYDKALPLYEQSLKIREKVLGKEHPNTAISYNNLAALYQSMGAYDKVLPLYKKSLKIRENVLGKEDPNTATSYNNLAWLYFGQKDYKKAYEYMQKAVNVFNSVFPSEHPHLKASLEGLAIIRAKLGSE